MGPRWAHMIGTAVEFATTMHAGQWRKDGLPYITHPLDVLRRVARWGVARDRHPEVWVAATLHDVLKDTAATPAEIVLRWGEDVGQMVEALTYRMAGSVSGYDYFHRVAAGDVAVLVIKVADRMSTTLDSYIGGDREEAIRCWTQANPLFAAVEARATEIVSGFGDRVQRCMAGDIRATTWMVDRPLPAPLRPTRPAPVARPPGSYTHVGGRGAVGHYSVTADAHRTPGRSHALNVDPRGGYVSLCGVHIAETSDDHFVGHNPVWPATEGGKVTCGRCRRAVAGTGTGPAT